MKKTVFLLVLLIQTASVRAQKNFISTDPFLPIFGTVELQYERQVLSRMSISLGVGNKFSSGILEISGFDGDHLTSGDLSFSGIRILPEFRWYISKSDKGLTGFYAGAYYKYQTNTSSVKVTYRPDALNALDEQVDVDLQTHSAGIEVGYKLPIFKKIYADFIIGGIGIASSALDVNTEGQAPDGLMNEIAKEVRSIFPFDLFSPDLSLTNESIHSDFMLPSLRYGVKIGVGF